MTFKELQKLISSSERQQQESLSISVEEQNPKLMALLQKLKGLPFWISDVEAHKKQSKRTNGFCCFWHQFQPSKREQPQRCYDYEQNIIDLLENKSC